jgi:hypothetical protein
VNKNCHTPDVKSRISAYLYAFIFFTFQKGNCSWASPRKPHKLLRGRQQPLAVGKYVTHYCTSNAATRTAASFSLVVSGVSGACQKYNTIHTSYDPDGSPDGSANGCE